MTAFTVYMSGEVLLDLDDVWADDERPENPTAADVARAMRDYGGKSVVIRDWGLLDALAVSVDLEDVWT